MEQPQQPHEHPLKLVTCLSNWFCDNCHARHLNQFSKRFRCGQCGDYDLCSKCASLSNPVHKHETKLVTYSNGQWWCDGCQRWNHPLRFRCYQCWDFDLCSDCFNKQQPQQPIISANVRQQMQEEGEEEVEEGSSGQANCTVCLENPKTIAFRPCGHFCCCVSCAAKVQECPFCRALITEKFRIFNV